MQKRAQVTVFIILGIIIIAVIAAIAFSYGDRIQNFTRPGVLDASSLEPLKSFVASCMKESVSSDLELLKKNSGYFTKISSTVVYSGYEINAIVDKSLNSPNKMNSKAGIENEISRHVENEIVNAEVQGEFDMNDYFLENKDVTVTRTDADNGLIYRIVTNKEEDGFVFGVKNE